MAEYVDKDEMQKELLAQCLITGYGGLTPNDVKICLGNVKAADVRGNVRGEWIYDGEYEEYSDNIWKCSKCEHTWNFIGGYFSHPLDYDANFCPNCGADLRNSNTRSMAND